MPHRARPAQLTSLPNRDETLAIDFSPEIRSDSDHHPFYMRNIPILMLHTGLHGDYHRPSDDVEKLNIDGMHRVARLLYGIVTIAANEPATSEVSRRRAPRVDLG